MFGLGAFGDAPFGGAPPYYKVDAAHTKAGQERLRAYFEALGRFVDKFSRVEAAVTKALWHYAKTDPEIARIVFSGDNIENGMNYIKQLALVTGAEGDLIKDLEFIFQQLRIIKKVRNYVLHYGAEKVAEGKAIVSDAIKAKSEPHSFPISPTSLDQMTADLDKIIAHIKIRHLNDRNGYTLLGSPLCSPWQYKHPVPLRKPAKSGAANIVRERGAKRPRSPRSSPA